MVKSQFCNISNYILFFRSNVKHSLKPMSDFVPDHHTSDKT